jgi:hypothetical protein
MKDIVKEALAATRWNPAAWMGIFGKIRLKAGDVTSCEPNEYQRKLSEIITYCHERSLPCRIIALKPRQKGSTTFSVAAAYRRLMAKIGRGLFAGGSHFQAANMWKILTTYNEYDVPEGHRCKIKNTEAIYDNGATLERITLRNAQAGRSGTYQVLIITEVAYLSDEGVANADDVVAGLLKCVPDEPDTIIIEESTAHGAVGYFHDKYKLRSVTFEEFKAGKPGTIRVFSPWYEFADSRRDPAREQIFKPEDLTRTEIALMEEWDLGVDQVAWMRWAIREECNGDFEKFMEDYPFDDDSAFLKSGRCKFSAASIKRQDKRAELANWRYGEFVRRPDESVGWVELPYEQSMWAMREEPRDRMSYLLACDPATGDSRTSGADPDSHGCGMLRAGYVDQSGDWVEPALVLRNSMHKDGDTMACRWDTDVLAEQLHMASLYYGDCLIAPEMNKDNGLVEILKVKGANIYTRTEINRRTDEPTQYLGWKTDASNRGMIIDKFAAAIRDSGTRQRNKGFDVSCPWTVAEMRSFVINAAGRAEAASKKHDDQVMMLCIGYNLIELATPFFAKARNAWTPPEIRQYERQQGQLARGEFRE